MKYYYFGGGDHTEDSKENNRISLLEESGFTGVLFTYNAWQGDYMVKMARDLDPSQKIIYMAAIRPHVISPQYLTMISQAMSSIMPNRFQVNLISGHIKEEEKTFGGILGEVTDLSSHIDRSNYLIKYLEELDKMKNQNTEFHELDFFVSTTNEYVFNVASKLKNKMIIPYRDYKNKHWTIYTDYQKTDNIIVGNKIDFKNKTIMISVAPIIRKTQEEIDALDKTMWTNDTEYFSYKGFYDFIKKLESEGINHLMVHGWPAEESEEIIKCIKLISSPNFKKEINIT